MANSRLRRLRPVPLASSNLGPYVALLTQPAFPRRFMTTHDAGFMTPILIFCAGAVIAVPLFKRAGLGAVIGYLAAGLAIGPSGFGLFNDAATVSGVAELGIVLLLFVIGLELKFPTLVAMRRDIFGLGLAQFAVTAASVGLLAYPMLARRRVRC